MARRVSVALFVIAMLTLAWAPAAAQTLGTFRWQLQPHCNVITVTVVQQGSQYQLDGTDDQCGATAKAAVRGLAFVNPSGSIGFGFVIVQSSGHQVPVAATIALSTLSGAWQANGGGLFGPFVFTPGAGTGGAPLPLGGGLTSVVAGPGLLSDLANGTATLSVDYAATQQRVTGVCPAGQLMTGVQQNGQVSCQAVTGGGGGDITAVTASTGLFGGGIFGDVMLGVDFGGSGASVLVARADHTHEPNNTRNIAIGSSTLPVNTGQDNIAIGSNAMASNTSGGGNVAVGTFSLRFGTGTQSNVAIGQAALESTTGSGNTAVGYFAGRLNTGGSDNVAVGVRALTANTTASFNTAVGAGSLQANTTGLNNTAVGRLSLNANTTGTNNVAVGAGAMAANLVGIDNVAVGLNALNQATVSGNTAIGSGALGITTTGGFNTAVGRGALDSNTVGASNAAFGNGALGANSSGLNNAAIGSTALAEVTSGSDNVGVGYQAGLGIVTGSNNIHIGTGVGSASTSESNTIRIGNSAATATFIRGIHAATSSSGIQVFINGSGQLGTATSSARFKEQVEPLGTSASARVLALRPVSFVYKPAFDDGSRQVQYGLIAEEVASTFPELLVRDEEGRPQTVRYHLLTPLLLAEVQRLQQERDSDVARLRAEREQLELRVRALEAALATLADRLRDR